MAGYDQRLVFPPVQLVGLEEGQTTRLLPRVFDGGSGIEYGYIGEFVCGAGGQLSFRSKLGATNGDDFFAENRTKLWLRNVNNGVFERQPNVVDVEYYFYVHRMGPAEAMQHISTLFTIADLNGAYSRYNDNGWMQVRIRVTSTSEGRRPHFAFCQHRPDAVQLRCPRRGGGDHSWIFLDESVLGRLGANVFTGMPRNHQSEFDESYEDVMDVLRSELQATFVRGIRDLIPLAHVARRLSLLNAAHALAHQAQRIGYDPRELLRYGAMYDDHVLVETTVGNLTADQAMRLVANAAAVPQRILPLVRARIPAAIGQLSLVGAVGILERPEHDNHGHPNPQVPFIGQLRHHVKALMSRFSATDAATALSAQNNITLPYVRQILHNIVKNQDSFVF